MMENVFQYHVGSCCLSVIWSGSALRVIIILFIAGKLLSQAEDCKFSKGRSNRSC